MYGLLLFLKCFHWITADRVDYVGSPFSLQSSYSVNQADSIPKDGPDTTSRSTTPLSHPDNNLPLPTHTCRPPPRHLFPRYYPSRRGLGDGPFRFRVHDPPRLDLGDFGEVSCRDYRSQTSAGTGGRTELGGEEYVSILRGSGSW